jgi:hypothetical protein
MVQQETIALVRVLVLVLVPPPILLLLRAPPPKAGALPSYGG